MDVLAQLLLYVFAAIGVFVAYTYLLFKVNARWPR